MGNYILADNQELTRFAVEQIIKADDQNNVSIAVDKAGLVALLKEQKHAVVVLDYTLFDFADEDQLLITSERFENVTWILLSEELTSRFLVRMLYASHNFSVVFKDGPLSELRSALSAAERGERYISQKATELVLSQRVEEERPDVLTTTEAEILRSVARGKTTKEIAAERFSSIHTINTHKKNIFRKLKVNTAHEATKYALRAGLVDPSEFYI